MALLADLSPNSENSDPSLRLVTPEDMETLEPMSFEDYRTLCDTETDSFRRVGVLEQDAYSEAIQDQRTVFCEIEGRRVPALVPLQYEARYNDERTKELSGKHKAMLLSIPLKRVREGALLSTENLTGGEDFSDDVAILIEEPVEAIHGDRDSDHTTIAHMLGGLGVMEAHEFIDTRLEKYEDNRTAWMGIFAFSITSSREIDEEKYSLSPEDAIVQAWEEYRTEKGLPAMPDKNSDDTFLFTAEQLKEHPEIVDGLWAVSEVGFGNVLGKYHPVAMEVTREFFDKHITSESVLTAVRYVDGEPACFGFLAPNMENNDWLDTESTILKHDLQTAAENGEPVIHFFELISKGKKGAMLSPSVLDLHIELAGRSRQKWHVIFESTNLSGTYIPDIAKSRIQHSDTVAIARSIEMLSRLDYWYVTPRAVQESSVVHDVA